MGRRLALLIATYEYEDPGLRRLTTPAHDAEALAAVLEDPAIAGFEVRTLVNAPTHEVGEAIAEFYGDSRRDDLTLLYFTGHGLKDDNGRLHLAMSTTKRDRLRFTALSAQLVDEAMADSLSRQKILILDCCYSGSYQTQQFAKSDSDVHTLEKLGGRGRTVLTASDSTQYAFEGSTIHGEAAQSVFTRHLVDGLRDGTADLDGDGDITVDEALQLRLRPGHRRTAQPAAEEAGSGRGPDDHRGQRQLDPAAASGRGPCQSVAWSKRSGGRTARPVAMVRQRPGPPYCACPARGTRRRRQPIRLGGSPRGPGCPCATGAFRYGFLPANSPNSAIWGNSASSADPACSPAGAGRAGQRDPSCARRRLATPLDHSADPGDGPVADLQPQPAGRTRLCGVGSRRVRASIAWTARRCGTSSSLPLRPVFWLFSSDATARRWSPERQRSEYSAQPW